MNKDKEQEDLTLVGDRGISTDMQQHIITYKTHQIEEQISEKIELLREKKHALIESKGLKRSEAQELGAVILQDAIDKLLSSVSKIITGVDWKIFISSTPDEDIDSIGRSGANIDEYSTLDYIKRQYKYNRYIAAGNLNTEQIFLQAKTSDITVTISGRVEADEDIITDIKNIREDIEEDSLEIEKVIKNISKLKNLSGSSFKFKFHKRIKAQLSKEIIKGKTDGEKILKSLDALQFPELEEVLDEIEE